MRDLDSINGVLVNAERITQKALSTGDVVSIEDFKLTFVLDEQPVGESVRVSPPTLELRAEDAERFTMLGTPNGACDAPTGLSSASQLEAAPVLLPLDEDELLIDVEAEQGALDKPEPEVSAVASPAASQEPLRLELELDPTSLPEPLRKALQALDGADVAIPTMIRLRVAGAED